MIKNLRHYSQKQHSAEACSLRIIYNVLSRMKLQYYADINATAT